MFHRERKDKFIDARSAYHSTSSAKCANTTPKWLAPSTPNKILKKRQFQMWVAHTAISNVNARPINGPADSIPDKLRRTVSISNTSSNLYQQPTSAGGRGDVCCLLGNFSRFSFIRLNVPECGSHQLINRTFYCCCCGMAPRTAQCMYMKIVYAFHFVQTKHSSYEFSLFYCTSSAFRLLFLRYN